MARTDGETPRGGGWIVPAVALVGVALVWASPEFFWSRLFPYGIPPPLASDKLTFSHGKLRKIYERCDEVDKCGDDRLLRSPETVFFGPDETLYTATDRGYLVSLTDFLVESPERITAKTTLVKDLGPGRPLGAKFTPDGNTLYIADAVLGLLRIRDPSNSESKVEIVASTVVDAGRRTRLNFVDDVVIGPRTGRVYFTDGEQAIPEWRPGSYVGCLSLSCARLTNIFIRSHRAVSS
jgi:hypothetical protein